MLNAMPSHCAAPSAKLFHISTVLSLSSSLERFSPAALYVSSSCAETLRYLVRGKACHCSEDVLTACWHLPPGSQAHRVHHTNISICIMISRFRGGSDCFLRSRHAEGVLWSRVHSADAESKLESDNGTFHAASL